MQRTPEVRALLPVLVLASMLALSGCNLFKGKVNRDNLQPPAELTEFQASAQVSEVWSQGVGEVEDRLGLRKAPAVADGRVYVGDLEGRVLALDASSGAELWSVDTGIRIGSTIGVGDGLLVLGGLDGEVVALDAAGGAERWRARVSSEVLAAPAIARGVVVVRSHDGRLFGLDAASGERRWLYDRGLPALTLRGNAAPVIIGGTVHAGYDDGRLVALRLEDGGLQWEQLLAVGEGRTDLERMVDVDGPLVVEGSEAYAITYQGQAAGLAGESGQPLWSREFSSYGGLSIAGDRLLVADEDGALYALDRRSGGALWKLDALAHRWLTTPAVQGGHAVVGDFDGYLHWIDLDSGQLAARTRVGRDAIRAQPVVGADGTLYAMTVDGKLAAYRLASP